MHIERLLPLDSEQKRIKAKYASKKPLWGRGHGRTAVVYSAEQVGHMKWLYAHKGWAVAIRFGMSLGMARSYAGQVLAETVRASVPAVKSLHIPD